ncbi:DUF4135 domain-containing protein [Clostridium perfringens]|uniref:DUF4135 domain-containing protein n=1 Tax=Clostridium perfringens TaxID=1502 RepID=UPI0013E3B147|nr:DUF4135 domain-containing protein [Clostridium perfringens]NGT56965.1 DUF4135 domain-containing protein [Clostridium perfringens]NGT95626.1 DUF4135 domain-containing protein [Clostridium perfringens]
MIKKSNIRENECFEVVIENISKTIYKEVQRKIQDIYRNKFLIILDKLYLEVYQDIRNLLIPILVQDINEWQESIENESNDYKKQYEIYCENFFEGRYTYLLNRYKRLADTINLYKADLFFAINKFILNLIENRRKICLFFLLDNNKFIIEFIKFVGDKHSADRNICFKLNNIIFYYKIRGMKVQLLADKINKEVFSCKYFKFPKSIIFTNFMIQENVINNDCENIKDIESFYFNTGVMLFYIYLLNGIDFHNENIIADGRFPILIDTETVISTISSKDIGDLGSSVFASAMLPMKYSKYYNGICDTSGIGQKNKILKKYIAFENPFSSKIKLKFIKVLEDDIVSFLPRFNGVNYDALNYLHCIINGFQHGYNLAMKNKLAYKRIIDNADNLMPRFIFRNTCIYSELLKRLYAPDTMKSNIYTYNFLKKFLKNIPHVNSDKKEKYINQEIEQLLKGYIPHFKICSKNYILRSNSEEVLYEDLSETLSVKKSLMTKLMQLSEEDLFFQIELISVSLNINNHNFKKINFNYNKPILRLIEESIHVINGKLLVLTLQKDWQGNYIYGNIKDGLYEGALGLILAESKFNSYFSYQKIEKNILDSKDIGLINGYSSIILYNYYVSNLEKEVYFLEDIIFTQYDVIDGLAGYILLVYRKYIINKEELLLDYILKLIEKFMMFSIVNEEKIGFAHGLSGLKIIYIIAFKLTNKQKYLDKYKVIDEKDDINRYSSGAWCNGLTGYLVSEYIMYKITNKETHLIKIIDNLDKLFIFAYKIDDYCLCHGVFGILDFLLTLQQNNLLNDEFKLKFKKLEEDVFTTLDKKSILIKDISLFTGISGIQYYYNRKKENRKSILSLCY